MREEYEVQTKECTYNMTDLNDLPGMRHVVEDYSPIIRILKWDGKEWQEAEEARNASCEIA